MKRPCEYFAKGLAANVGLLGLVAMRAAAQGCAMCYQNAAASSAQGRTALRHGILILLLPALGVFFGICALIYRRRNISRSGGTRESKMAAPPEARIT
jgi:hypothetical protein